MSESNQGGKVVKNTSQAHNYKYSSLADLHKAGINIPKMRVKATEYGEFIEYLDAQGDWQMGAKIVPIESKVMNPAQAYGASLTYARRYTVQMAEQVACDDDDAIEKDDTIKKSYGGISFDDIRAELQAIDDEASVIEYGKEIAKKFKNPTEKQSNFIKKMLSDRIKEIRGEI